MDFKRKMYSKLAEWKADPNHLPLIVDGLRQIGKSYIVAKFANENYENIIIYDFRHNKTLRQIFDGDLDVESIIRNSSPYFPNSSFVAYKTVLIFEEIGDCPLARTSLKSFALDKRFDVIATGSLLGVLNINRKAKIDIPDGYEKIVEMTSMDFEEFLWANNVKEETIETLKQHLHNNNELPKPLEIFFVEMMKRYIVVGGMPNSVKSFLLTNNYIKSREVLEGLLKEYRGDFGRFINDKQEEEIDYHLAIKLNEVFDSIPAQLARESESHKFKYSMIKQGGRSKEYEDAFEWLEKAGLVLRCFNVKAIESPLSANEDKTYFKAFISDIGLLMAMYPIANSQELLKDELDSRKGAIFENLIATMINKCGLPLNYFSKGDEHLEIDYILESINGIVLLEEKSTNGKMAASKAVMMGETPYKAKTCYKIIRNNFGKGNYYITIPHYATPFLLNNIKEELSIGMELPPLTINE